MRQALGKLGTARPGKPEATRRMTYQTTPGAGRHRFRQDGEVLVVRLSMEGGGGKERQLQAPAGGIEVEAGHGQAGRGRDQDSGDGTFGALAHYERALTRERVLAGLAAAKRRGRRGGRPHALGPEQIEPVVAALKGGASRASVCRSFKVARSTLLDTLEKTGWSEPVVAVPISETEETKLPPLRICSFKKAV